MMEIEGRPGVIPIEGAYPCQAGLRGLPNRQLGGEGHHHVAHCVVPVHQRGHGVLSHATDLRAKIDPSSSDPLAIVGKAEDAVRVHAAEVRLRHSGGADSRILLRKVQGRQNTRDECLQSLCRENARGSLECHTTPPIRPCAGGGRAILSTAQGQEGKRCALPWDDWDLPLRESGSDGNGGALQGNTPTWERYQEREGGVKR